MDIILENFGWMIFNIALAVLGLTFGLLFLNVKNRVTKGMFFVLWVLFLPNTIYLITDIQYLPEQLLKSSFEIQIILFGQYILLLFFGILSFILGLRPFEKIFKFLKLKKHDMQSRAAIIFLSNFIIAFGVTLGKFERVHSWYIFTSTDRVIHDSLLVLSSKELMMIVILFGLLFNLIYFSAKRFLRVKF